MSTAPRKIGILLLAVCLSFTRSMLPCIWRHPRWQRGGLSYFQGTRALTRFSLPRRNRVTCIRRDRHPQVFQTPDTRSIPSFSSSPPPLLLILYSLYLILYDLNVYYTGRREILLSFELSGYRRLKKLGKFIGNNLAAATPPPAFVCSRFLGFKKSRLF